MIEFWADTKADEHARLDAFRHDLQDQYAGISLASIGGNRLVLGAVRTYSLKAEIEALAKSYGLLIQNCVRVVPGRENFAPKTFRQVG